MEKVRNISITMLGVIYVIYYFLLVIFGGKISFSTFWLMLAIVMFLIGMIKKLEKNKKIKVNKSVKKIFTILVSLGAVSFIIIEGFIIASGSNNKFKQSDYLLILGAGLRGERMSLALSQRMYKSLEYIDKYPDVKIIVSGGKGPREYITEAEAMKRFLVKHGVDENNIVKEEKSTSTAENIEYTKEKLKQIDGRTDIKISIVTTNFHMFRAQFLAKRVGFDTYAVPAKLHFLLIPNYYVREYFAVINSYIFDRIGDGSRVLNKT
ncbi:YdcF family protein [Clostridium ganghwense]|uniref:YdcF family protein n=1 Tax=Clostridium ganghwense TaxID=312089 RepID=A0ABT4CPF9_9CLOT|nr:YdcF family protein [Clostridium ganghwense]MCY6370940.1 YdcF family protein [Clostridium ganghwense]